MERTGRKLRVTIIAAIILSVASVVMTGYTYIRLNAFQSKLPEGYYPVLESSKSNLSYGNTAYVLVLENQTKIAVGVKDKYVIANLWDIFINSTYYQQVQALATANTQMRVSQLVNRNEIAIVRTITGTDTRVAFTLNEISTITEAMDEFFRTL